jgi:microsomal epoxide hydrolase
LSQRLWTVTVAPAVKKQIPHFINRLILLVSLQLCITTAPAQRSESLGKSRFIKTSDGVRIHCLDKGRGPAILFVPGWTMPAEIWEHQILYFARNFRVVAMDPRSQGRSSDTNEGHYPAARARDLKSVVDQLKLAPVVLVGWSLGAMEVAAYVDEFGTGTIKAVVLVDGRVGDDFHPERTPGLLRQIGAYQRNRPAFTSGFVRSLYKKPQSDAYFNRLTAASLHTPTDAALALMVGYLTSDYRGGLAKINKPTLIFVAGRAPDHEVKLEMQKQIAGAELEVFDDAGHALFVDEPKRFNNRLERFLKQR